MASLPKPNQEDLEDITSRLLPKVFGSHRPAQRYGRSGQAQSGIDVLVQLPDQSWVAAQCKAYEKAKLKPALLDQDLLAAHAVVPPLAQFVVVTSASRDTALLDWARSALLHGRPNVQIWCWEDLVELLDQYDLLGTYIARTLGPWLMPAISAAGLIVTNQPSLDGGPSVRSDDYPEVRELQRLLASGRASAVIERLEHDQELDEPRAFELARAYLQQRDNDKARICLAALTSVRATALASLVHARLGDVGASGAFIKRARSRADDSELPYVIAMDLLRRLAIDELAVDWDELNESVPTSVRHHPTVLGALADVASALNRYDDAIALYQAAESASDSSNTLRRVALLTNRLARSLSALPRAEFAVRDPEARNELEEIFIRLKAEDRVDLDVRARVSVQHGLHLAALALNDLEASLKHIEVALGLDSSNALLWIRWALAMLVSDVDVDPVRLASAPADPMLDMLLSQVEVRRGDRERALARIERALGCPELPPPLEARLQAHRIVLASPEGSIGPAEAEQLFSLQGTLKTPAPAIICMTEVVNAPGMNAVAERFLDWIEADPLEGLEDEEKLGVVAALVQGGHSRRLAQFLPLLRELVSLPNGGIDYAVAPLLISVLADNCRLSEAADVAERFAKTGSAHGMFLRAQLLVKIGEPSRAIDELLENVAVTRGSPSLLRLIAVIARLCGRLREVQRAVRQWTLPLPRSAADHEALHTALALLRDRRRAGLAADTLRESGGFENVAATLFSLGLRSPLAAPQRVCADALVTVKFPEGPPLDYWTGPSSSPLPDTVFVPWMSPVLGHAVGDVVQLYEGPFAGQRATILSTRRPDQILLERAAGAAAAVGDLRRFEGDTNELVARITAALHEQREADAQRFSAASSVGLPAFIMSKLSGRPARAFLRADGAWIPRSAMGLSSEIERERVALRRASRWIIDPATVCLIVECGLEHMFVSEALRPWISRHTRQVLIQWQLEEHERKRGQRGSFHLRPSGKLLVVEASAIDRRAGASFWRRVWSFVRGVCEESPVPTDDSLGALASWSEVLDVGAISSVAIAKEHRVAVLSDELVVRTAAAEFGVDGLALRGAVVHARIQQRISADCAVQAFTALARTGREFLSLPFALLRHSVLRMPPNLRSPCTEALLSTVKNADPVGTWPSLLGTLAANHRGRKSDRRIGMNEKRLLRLILRHAPQMDSGLARSLLYAVVGRASERPAASSWRGAEMRPLRRMLGRYLSRYL